MQVLQISEIDEEINDAHQSAVEGVSVLFGGGSDTTRWPWRGDARVKRNTTRDLDRLKMNPFFIFISYHINYNTFTLHFQRLQTSKLAAIFFNGYEPT